MPPDPSRHVRQAQVTGRFIGNRRASAHPGNVRADGSGCRLSRAAQDPPVVAGAKRHPYLRKRRLASWPTKSSNSGRPARPSVNGWLAIPSGFSAEVMAQCGFEASPSTCSTACRTTSRWSSASRRWTRTRSRRWCACRGTNRASSARRSTAAPWGIICPMMNNREGGRGAGRYAKYPPIGKRSNGPIRAADVRRGEQLPVDRQRRDAGHPDDRDPGRRSSNIDEILDVPGHQPASISARPTWPCRSA